MPVVRYHSLLLMELPQTLVPLAYTASKELMAFKHSSLPIYAVQFHPEAWLTKYGLDILRNWLNIAEVRGLQPSGSYNPNGSASA